MTTGVLPFVRGVDFSHHDFSVDGFPENIGALTGLRWLKLNNSKLERVPEQLSQLKNLEQLQLIGNNLASVHGELSDLPALRSVCARHNQIKTSGIPEDIFDMNDLTIVDFSHNALRDVPANLDHAKSTIVLNLSHNSIEQVPNQVFVNMTDLLHLDLSNNKLEMLPPQIRRLVDLQLKQLPFMTSLRVLHMQNTERNASNIPPVLDNLVNLEDVDFSRNELEEVPDALFQLKNLRKLNLSQNKIASINSYTDECWAKLELLNLSDNQLKAIPPFFCRLTCLKRFFVNCNKLDFEGIPAGIGKLICLEVFQASYNSLELVPEGLCRCAKLKRLKLDHNRLVTLPPSIHLLPDLKELDVRYNADLIMPPKPAEMQKGSGLPFYNIDFSLDHQMRLAGAAIQASGAMNGSMSSVASSNSPTPKDPVTRKIQYLKRRKGQSEADSDQRKILKGMEEVAHERDAAEKAAQEGIGNLRPKRWDEALEKPQLDYSEFFDDETGHTPGLMIWEIENFLPNLLDEAFHGKFYEGDCYIVLHTFETEPGSDTFDFKIYYWIGEKATLDKKACAAIHAVNLRNYLGATCRTQREEMEDETDEFMDLFGDDIIYIEGGRTLSGFYSTEERSYSKRFYRISAKGAHIHLESVAVSPESLDPRFVFLLDTGLLMWLWFGKKSKKIIRSKARLFAEKTNKYERKGNASIDIIMEGLEVPAFWTSLTDDTSGETPNEPVVEHVPSDFEPARPKLYEVNLGKGYLELPQIRYLWQTELAKELLQTKCVYILDCFSDIFVWIGRKSTRLVRAAGIKLASELRELLPRPHYAEIHKDCEDTESAVFKSKFVGWDDVIAVDFTRTAESVNRRGADLNIILERDKIKTDLTALFLERQPMLSEQEAEELMTECNEDLELIDSFVLENGKFVRLPQDEFGIFFSMDCYVFLCRYWVPIEEPETSDAGKASDDGSDDDDKTRSSCEKTSSSNGTTAEDSEETTADDFQCVVYFWQGREASNMGWLRFTFSLQKKFESLFKDKLEVVRMYQQQENQKFLSHFKKKFVIKRGRRHLSLYPGVPKYSQMYHIRSNGSAITTRTIQVDVDSGLLNSTFCFILRVPYRIEDDEGHMGRVFVWTGEKSSSNEASLAEEIANEILNPEGFPVDVQREGNETDIFWDSFKSGKKDYDKDGTFMLHTRLFRCTNEKGYFSVSEKTIDFCQDDLEDDDIMMLDTGEQLYIWIGSASSEVEVKLAYKAAQVYVQHLRLREPNKPRKMLVTLKGREPKRFTRCFHAWGKHRQAP